MKKQILLASLIGVWGWCCAVDAAPPKPPNILYILADDLGYADVGFNGSQEIPTPNLDRLAHGGANLKSFYVQPVCSPTRAALMTGRYAAQTGVYTVVRPNSPWGLKLEERTLADALRDAGYETAIVGKWHLGEFQPDYRPTRRGFEQQYGLWFGMIDHFTHLREGQLDWRRNDQLCHDEGYSTELLAKEACRVIRERRPDKPLFLYLPFNAVHDPYQAPDKYVQPFAHLSGKRRIYAGMIAAMDEAVGQVLAALKEQGMRDDTLIIFSSDNGGPSPDVVTSNRPLRGGKASLFEGGVRVCACANWPGRIPAGAEIQEPLHAIDWYPTLLTLCGGSLDQKTSVDGLGVWPVLTKGAKSPHDTILLHGMRRNHAALRRGDWKLIVDRAARPPQDVLLFNLADDLGEEHNLATEEPAKVAELRSKLDALMDAAVASGEVQRINARPKRSVSKR